MSTGLTFVTIADNSGIASPFNGGTFIFNDYSEAYAHGEWLTGIYNNLDILYTIWTSGPNQSGYWVKISGVVSFTPVD